MVFSFILNRNIRIWLLKRTVIQTFMNNTLSFQHAQTSNSVLSHTIVQDHNTQYSSMSLPIEEPLPLQLALHLFKCKITNCILLVFSSYWFFPFSNKNEFLCYFCFLDPQIYLIFPTELSGNAFLPLLFGPYYW